MCSTPIFDELCAIGPARGGTSAAPLDTPADPPDDGPRPAPRGRHARVEQPAVRLSVTVVWVATLAEQEALDLGHRRLGTEHLMLALARLGDPVGRRLAAHGASLAAVRRAIVRAGEPGALDNENGRPGWSTAASTALATARRRARAEGRDEVTTTDLAAAMLLPAGRAVAVLTSLGVDPEVALGAGEPAPALGAPPQTPTRPAVAAALPAPLVSLAPPAPPARPVPSPVPRAEVA